MDPSQTDGPGVAIPEPTAKTEPPPAPQIHRESTAGTAATPALVAPAVRYLAAGDAQFDQLIVPRCPVCGFAHRHVAFEQGDVFERSPSCSRRLTYLVQVVEVVPLAPPLREQGAA